MFRKYIPYTIIAVLFVTVLYFLYLNFYLKPTATTSKIITSSVLSPTIFINNELITYSNQKYGYKIQFPRQFHAIEDETRVSIDTGLNNKVIIDVIADTSPTITEYLIKADKISQTAWEGQPSLEVQSTKKTVISGLNCIQRQEYLLAADLTQIKTYYKNNSYIITITLLPTPGNVFDMDFYNNLLSTLKFY